MPRVSVIIPAFNAELHIGEALRSVVAQSYTDWEAVVVDDGSTDRTSDVAGGFGDRVQLVRSRRNVGLAAARNLAIEHSSGQLLALLDADDYWLPDYLEHQVGTYEAENARDGRVGIVACDARLLEPGGRLARTYADFVEPARDATVAHLLRSNPIFVGAMTPRHVVDEAGGFAADLRRAEDHDLWLRVVELGYRVVFTRRPLVVYRVHDASLSARPDAMARATRLVLERALERGNLTARQRRIARREIRRHRAIERIATEGGLSMRGVLTSLPLLARVAAENPRRWPSFARVAATRGRSLARFGGRVREYWFLDDAPIFGGAERIVMRLAQHVEHSLPGRTARVVCPAHSELAERCRAGGVDVVHAAFPGRGVLEAPRIPLGARRLRSVLAAAGGDALVVGATLRAHVYAHAALLGVRWSPAIVHFMPEQDSARRLTTRLVLRQAVVALGENAAQAYRARLRGVPVTSVNNFLLPEELDAARLVEDPRPASAPPAIGVLARLTPEKGVLELVDELAAHPASWSTLVVGGAEQDPRHADAIRRRLAERRIHERVRLVGQVEDLASFFREVDVLVVPSTGTEGQPAVIVEALAFGRPVVVRSPIWSPDFEGLPVLPYRSHEELETALAETRSLGPVDRDLVARAFGVVQMLAAFEHASGLPALAW